MSEITVLEQLVLSVVQNAGTIRASELFNKISDRAEFSPYTTREVVAAIWRLKDRRLISVAADGTLTVLSQTPSHKVAALA